MEIDSGELICPKCGKNGMSDYLKYQCKKNRWIFYKKDKGWQYKANIHHDHEDNEFFTWEFTEDANKCWENYEGEIERFYIFPAHTGFVWQCNNCDYVSRNFHDFINKP